MEPEYDFSKLGSLNLRDIGKGILMAAGTGAITPVVTSLATGALIFNPVGMALAGLSAGLTYLLKQLMTGDSGKLLTNK